MVFARSPHQKDMLFWDDPPCTAPTGAPKVETLATGQCHDVLDLFRTLATLSACCVRTSGSVASPPSPGKSRMSAPCSTCWQKRKGPPINSNRCGILCEKRSGLEEALTDTVTQPQRKAVVPSKGVIWALEEGAGCETLSPSPRSRPPRISGLVHPWARPVPGGMPRALQQPSARAPPTRSGSRRHSGVVSTIRRLAAEQRRSLGA